MTALTTDPYARAPRLPGDGPIDPRTLFPDHRGPLELEIGPGRGGFVFERLDAAPGSSVLGLEIRRKWATIVDDRLAGRGYSARARVFAEDAKLVLPRFPAGCISAVFIHFPDPWWKKRHGKRRVVSPDFVAEVARVLAAEGELFIQTDVPERAELFEELIALEPRLRPWGASARVEENPYGAKSPRERRAEADGLPIARLRYVKVAASGVT